jgi:hypothetical protein
LKGKDYNMYFIKIFSDKNNDWINKSKHQTELAAEANFKTLAEAKVPVRLLLEGKIIKEANYVVLKKE